MSDSPDPRPARRRRAATPKAPRRPVFTPVAVRPRADGWTPERQLAFVEALGESACVTEACARVGLSASSAYALRRRADAASFRAAWDAALDYAIRRLSDAAFSRALNGVPHPVFFQGEQIGERRRYDERLTMFLLRYRDPVRYGAWNDRMTPDATHDAVAGALADLAGRVEADARRAEDGLPPLGGPLPVHDRYAPPSADHDHESARAIVLAKLDLMAARLRGEEGCGPGGEGEVDGDVA